MAVLGAQRWTEADDKYIREAMPCTREEVARAARKLGRTRQAIQNRVRRYRGRVRRRWTPEEDALLLDIRLTPHTERYQGRSSLAEVAARIGVTETAAKSRYSLLKRKAGHEGGQWTDDGLWTKREDDLIRSQLNPDAQRVPNGTWDVIANRLGRTPEAVKQRAYKLRHDGTAGPRSEGWRRR